MTIPKIDPRIIADATLAAMYFRELREQGVPETAAIEFTKSYVQTHILARLNTPQRPREPWEGDDAP